MEYREMYDELRKQALSLLPGDINIKLNNNQQVYAALVDFSISGNAVSLFCAFDGTVSLYFENRQPVIGLGVNELIKKSAMSFLISAGQALPKLSAAKENEDIPFERERVYLLADKIYVAIVNNQISEKEIGFIDFLVQNVISEIRKSEEQLTS